MCGQRQEEGNKNKTGSLNRKKNGVEHDGTSPWIHKQTCVCVSLCVCITQRDRLQSVPHSRHAQHLGDERQGMQNLNNGNYP